MTNTPLIERITRTLAKMLRHTPEEFDIELDRYGSADCLEVVQVLNEFIGEAIEEEDLLEAIDAGDRARYAIEKGRIRALYGHSIEVDPGEPSKPQELLYVGLGSRDAERAERYGLRAGRRSFLHLAKDYEQAQETGRRQSREYVVMTVFALDAWEQGINFFDRGSLYLSDPIPTEFLEAGTVHSDGVPRLREGGGREEGGRERGSRERGGRERGGSRRRDGRGRGRTASEGRSEDPRREGGRDRDREPQRRAAEPEPAASHRDDRGRGGRDRERGDGRDGRGGPRPGPRDRELRRSEPARSSAPREERPTPRVPEPSRAEAEKPRPSSSRPSFGAGLSGKEAPTPIKEVPHAPRAAQPKQEPESKPESKPEPKQESEKPSRGPAFGQGI
jgi:putative RNA 2'-phosphotransferase